MATLSTEAWATGCTKCCTDMPTCLIVWCLGPCITYGQNVHAVRGTGFAGPCIAYCLFGTLCVPCVVAAGFRTELRKKYNLPEEPMSDCLVHGPCCSPCAVCQEAYELKIRQVKGPV